MRLLAEDADGLLIIAAAVQDALAKPVDMAFNRSARTFGLAINRFQWERAKRRGPWFRAKSVLAFAGVLSVRTANLAQGRDEVLLILDVTFEPGSVAPAGAVRLVFAGGAEMLLEVECLDVTLMDTGPAWPTPRRPDHDSLQEASRQGRSRSGNGRKAP